MRIRKEKAGLEWYVILNLTRLKNYINLDQQVFGIAEETKEFYHEIRVDGKSSPN